MRQEEASGILFNATELREILKSNFIDTYKFNLKGFKDIVRLQDFMIVVNRVIIVYTEP